MMWVGVALLLFVTVQRIAELALSQRNMKRLLARGGHEVAPGHYPFMVALHASWLALLWLLGPGPPIELIPLLVFLLLQLARAWVMTTLGERWTTRIIIVPGEPLVTGGPYRFVNHPNYLVVAGEILVLPLVFGLWQVALLFSALNAMILRVRIRAEDKALRG